MHGGDQRGVRGLGDHAGQGRVGGHVGEPVGRVGRVERHVGAAGLEDRDQGDHQVRAAFQADADQRFGADAEGAQAAGQAVGAAVELAVGERAAGVADGDRVGGAGGLLLEDLMGAAAVPRAGGAGDRLVDHGEFGGVEQVDGGQRGFGVLGDGGEQAGQVAGQPLHGRLVEQAGGVLELAAEGAVGEFGGLQGEVELGDLPGQRDLLGADAAEGEFAGLPVVQGERGLEQRGDGQVALGLEFVDQGGERGVLAVEGVQHRGAGQREQVGEGRVAVPAGAQHQGVDAVAGQVAQLRAGAAGDHGAHRDVGAAGPAGELGLVAGEQHGEQGGAVLGGQRAQPLGGRGGDGEAVRGALGGADRRAEPVGGQCERFDAAQLLLPVGELPDGGGPGAEIRALPGGVVGVLQAGGGQRRGQAVAERAVQRGEFGHQQFLRAFVAGDVVQGEGEQVVVGRQHVQGGAQGCVLLQVEGPGAEPAGLLLGEAGAVGCGPAGEIDGGQDARGGRSDQLDRLLAVQGVPGAQDLVPGGQFVERGGE